MYVSTATRRSQACSVYAPHPAKLEDIHKMRHRKFKAGKGIKMEWGKKWRKKGGDSGRMSKSAIGEGQCEREVEVDI